MFLGNLFRKINEHDFVERPYLQHGHGKTYDEFILVVVPIPVCKASALANTNAEATPLEP